jgi:hypothetical protein
MRVWVERPESLQHITISEKGEKSCTLTVRERSMYLSATLVLLLRLVAAGNALPILASGPSREYHTPSPQGQSDESSVLHFSKS